MAKTTPGDGLRIILLWLLTRPNIRSLDRKKNFTLIGNNRVHQDWMDVNIATQMLDDSLTVVQHRSEKGTDNLGSECGARRKLSVCPKRKSSQEHGTTGAYIERF